MQSNAAAKQLAEPKGTSYGCNAATKVQSSTHAAKPEQVPCCSLISATM